MSACLLTYLLKLDMVQMQSETAGIYISKTKKFYVYV